jgi:hypothetical protein
MANIIGAIDLNKTRVPITIPLGVACVLGAFEMYLGSAPITVLMCVAGLTITFIPLHFYGRDLYSMFSILFGIRYIGVALFMKVLYGQTLDSNLIDPTGSYAMTLLLMVVVTAVVLLARRFDPGSTLFAFPNYNLRKLAVACFFISLGAIAVVAHKGEQDDGASAGALFVIASGLSSLCAFALIAEAAYGVEKSKGRSLFTPFLGGMFLVILLAVIALNARGFFLNAVIGVLLVAFIYRVLNLKHVVIGLVFVGFFVSFLSPLTLYLRQHRKMPIMQFISLAQETAVKVAIDPSFRKVVSDSAKYAQFQNIHDEPVYDYFGDRSNVGNRLSFIGLVDAVYNSSKTHSQIGLPALQQSVKLIMPGFLGYVKDDVSVGDWLGWHTGLLKPPLTTFMNYGLPMEGLVTWGLIGFIVYPFVFMLPVLVVFSRISSFRQVTPLSIYIFTALQTGAIEATSDGFIGEMTRGVPIMLAALCGLYFIFRARPKVARRELRLEPEPDRHACVVPLPVIAETHGFRR